MKKLSVVNMAVGIMAASALVLTSGCASTAMHSKAKTTKTAAASTEQK